MQSEKDPRTCKIIGAAMEVRKTLGCGFLEAVYHEALQHEFAIKEIPFKRECEIPIKYKGKKLSTYYRADFICFDDIIVEIKAIKILTEIEEAQILNYLKATGFKFGLLFNFGSNSLEYKRYIYSV